MPEKINKLIGDSSSVDEEVSEYEFSESNDTSSDDFIEEISNENDIEEFLDDVDSVPINENHNVLISRSGFEWNITPRIRTRERSHNMIPQPSMDFLNNAASFETIADAFGLFISNDILEEVVECTNQYRQQYKGLLEGEILIDELKAFMGVLLASGRANGLCISLRSVWDTEPLFKQFYYSSVISRDRFHHIYQVLRFDDKATRETRKQISNDSFEAMRKVFNMFNMNCLNNYWPGPYLTVDERLVKFRGRCSFKVYMKSKPGRYGIKLWAAADAETSYLLNIQPYTGKLGGIRDINQGARVVKDLVSPFYGTHRGVTTDNFFTSVPLANKLLCNGLTLTGTMRANKKEIPDDFLKSRKRDVFSSIFGFNGDLTLVSYVPKKTTP